MEHEAHHDDRPGYTCLRTHPGDPGRVDKDLFNDLLAEIIGDSGGHSVGILVRQNKTVGELVTQLRLRGVAASQEGGFPLTDSAPVLVLLSLVRLADHPADSLAAFHVATSPLGSLLELDRDSTPGDYARVSRSLREQLANRGYGTVLGHYARQLATSTDLDERFRLAQFVRLATRYDLQATLRPAAFDRFVQNERFNDPSTDRVRVMTIHQAKGLEFDVVILPELDARLAGRSDLLAAQRPDPTAPPDRVLRTRSKDIRLALDDDIKAVYQADRNRDATEALCVMYVAMTRARYALHMLIPSVGKNRENATAQCRRFAASGVVWQRHGRTRRGVGRTRGCGLAPGSRAHTTAAARRHAARPATQPDHRFATARPGSPGAVRTRRPLADGCRSRLRNRSRQPTGNTAP